MKKHLLFAIVSILLFSCGKKAKEILENNSFVITDRWENGRYMMTADAATQVKLIDSIYAERKSVVQANGITFEEFKHVLIEKMDAMSYNGYRFYTDSVSPLDTRFPNFDEIKEKFTLDERTGDFTIIGPTGYKEKFKFELIDDNSFTLSVDGVKIKLSKQQKK
jgi:hypothetical protein